MPGKTIKIRYGKCHRESCSGDGICPAATACPRKLIRQEAPYEAPMAETSLCQGCSKCVAECPGKAIELI